MRKVAQHRLIVLVLQIIMFPTRSISNLPIPSPYMEYLIRSVEHLHSCRRDVLLVFQPFSIATSGQESTADLQHSVHLELSISLIDIDTFLALELINLEEAMPHCILIQAPDLQIQNSLTLAQKINDDLRKLSIFQLKPTVIFIWTGSSNDPLQILTQAFQNTNFSLDSNIYSVFVSNFDNQVNYQLRVNGNGIIQPYFISSIWEIYNLKQQHYIASYNNCQLGLQIHESSCTSLYDLPSISARRNDFRGQVITASAREKQEDWMRFKTVGDKLTLLGGFSVNLYWDLMTMLNFREAILIGDGLVTLPNNSIGGKTVSQLNSGDADISLSQSLIVPFRASQLTFLQPSYYGIIHVFFSQPSANSIRNIVTAPFKTTLWFTLIATWVILIVTVKISSYLRTWFETKNEVTLDPNEFWSSKSNNKDFKDDSSDMRFSKEIGMWAIAANCQKSWHICPTSISMKIVFLTGVICGVVSYVAYSAAIVSSLAVSIIPIKEFMDLITFHFKFTVHKRSEPFQVFLQGMIESNHLHQEVITISTEEEISHLMNPLKPNAFLTYPDLFYQTALQLNYSEIFICHHVSTVPVSDVLYKSGMFLKKGSEYAEIFNHKLIVLKERGFNFRYFQKYERKNVLPCAINMSGLTLVNPVAFSDVFTAFSVIFVGFIIALLLFLSEVIVNKYNVIKIRYTDTLQKEWFQYQYPQ